MAVTFDAVGPSSAGASSTGLTTLSWTHTVGGGVTSGAILVFVNVDAASGTSWAATVTCAGTSMTSFHAPEFTSDGFGGMIQAFWITGVATGANAIAVTVTGGTPAFILGASLSFSGVGGFGTPVLSNTASSASVAVAANTSGNFIAGAIACGDGALTAMSGAGTLRSLDDVSTANNTGNMSAGTAPATGSSVTLTWTSPAGTMALLAVEVQGTVAAKPSPPAPSPQLPPGWFPGSAAVTQDPGGIPFYPEPTPEGAAPAVVIPPAPDAAPYQPPLLPPGWFPGADRVTAVPGGVPFTQLPPPQTATQLVIYPVPEVLGEQQWLPLPPGYFPGSQSVSVDPGGIPFYSLPQPLTPPPAPPPVPVITGLAGGGTGYFTDQNGHPRLYLADNPWGLAPNAGRWNGGNWHGDYDTYLGARGAQGFTAIYTDPLGNTVNGGLFGDGRTYDGVYPFNSGASNDPSSGLNNTFWTRIDYMLARAAASGLTIFMNIAYCEGGSGDMDVGALSGKTSTQYQDYGANLGSRYKNTANIVWVVGNDYFGSFDTPFSNILTGLRGAGDGHVISVHNMPESTSRKQLDNGTACAWGTSNAQFSMVYTYNVTYLGVEQAYAEASPIPVILGDGYFYQGTAANFDRAVRQDVWHALTSGARGANTGSEAIWQWASTAAASTTSENYYANVAGKIRTAFESLTGWHLLIPDRPPAAALVTAGRGTRATPFTSGGGGGQYEPAFTDTYVSASITPDGSLAVVYMSHATTITIDQTKLGAGYTATWIDPITGATSSATTGTTYNSTAKGNNSQGEPDWVLAFQGPPVGGASTATIAGAGAVTDVATQAVTAALAGAGSITDVVTEAVTATLAGAGVVNASVAGGASTAAVAGAGAVTAAATQAVTATAAGAGAVAATPTQAATASLTAAGSVNASGAITGTANLAGAGTVTAKAAQAAGSALAAAGAVSASAGLRSTASLAAAGSLTVTGSTQAAFTVGALTASDLSAAALSAATAPGATAGGTLTASDKRTGGPGG